MIEALYTAVRDATYFGPALKFHPTSETVEIEAESLGDAVALISTEEVYEGIEYQPLNLATGYGRLRFVNAAELADTYLSFSDLVVLDSVPNDISVVAGMITEEFQTPLSHVNVLAQNRGTPNMGLRGATTRPELTQLADQWVKLVVSATSYQITPSSAAEAEQFRQEHAPPAVVLPTLDTTARELRDVKALVNESGSGSLRDQIAECIKAYGTKACNYGVLSNLANV